VVLRVVGSIPITYPSSPFSSLDEGFLFIFTVQI
jgi:hypothetical protein